MNLEQIMSDVAALLGVEYVTADEAGQYELRFDAKFDVRISLLDRSTVLLLAVVGRVSDDDFSARAYLERILTRSLLHCQEEAKEVISIAPDTREVCLHRTEKLSTLSQHHFQEVLEQFTNAVEGWTNYLTEVDQSSVPLPSMHLLMP